MSIFRQNSHFQVKEEVVRVRQVVKSAPRPQAPVVKAPASRLAPLPTKSRKSNGASAVQSNARVSGRESHFLAPLCKRKMPSPAASSPMLTSDTSDEEEDDWEERLDPRKRRKREQDERPVDNARQLAHPRMWTGEEEDKKRPRIIHAEEVASLKEDCEPALRLGQAEVAVQLRYPGSRYMERYQLVTGKDKIDTVNEIKKVVSLVASYSFYLTNSEAAPLIQKANGIERQLERSSANTTVDGPAFKAALQLYNEHLLSVQKTGSIPRNLSTKHCIPADLADMILDQVYDRTVAPKVDLLRSYANGTDQVYGELLHPFIRLILNKTGLNSSSVFVDLGSGVGQVVLQVALETGCASYGCEMMENPRALAKSQHDEFRSRCRVWGILPGRATLEEGDFRKNTRILDTLKRADVVLVNNQAFMADLNDNLVHMFLDLKKGCKVVSLKSFVHDHKNAPNDLARSILDVKAFTYPERGYVSWTDASGTFCISTRK